MYTTRTKILESSCGKLVSYVFVVVFVCGGLVHRVVAHLCKLVSYMFVFVCRCCTSSHCRSRSDSLSYSLMSATPKQVLVYILKKKKIVVARSHERLKQASMHATCPA